MVVGVIIVLAGYSFFFFQAEDGIRDLYVTGVQTCALPISSTVNTASTIAFAVYTKNAIVEAVFTVDGFAAGTWGLVRTKGEAILRVAPFARLQIGRASCRERV